MVIQSLVRDGASNLDWPLLVCRRDIKEPKKQTKEIENIENVLIMHVIETLI